MCPWRLLKRGKRTSPPAPVPSNLILPARLAPLAATAALRTRKPTGEAAAAAAGSGLRAGFVDVEGPAVEVCTVEGGDRLIGLRTVTHFYESKTSRPAGVPIG